MVEVQSHPRQSTHFKSPGTKSPALKLPKRQNHPLQNHPPQNHPRSKITQKGPTIPDSGQLSGENVSGSALKLSLKLFLANPALQELKAVSPSCPNSDNFCPCYHYTMSLGGSVPSCPGCPIAHINSSSYIGAQVGGPTKKTPLLASGSHCSNVQTLFTNPKSETNLSTCASSTNHFLVFSVGKM